MPGSNHLLSELFFAAAIAFMLAARIWSPLFRGCAWVPLSLQRSISAPLALPIADDLRLGTADTVVWIGTAKPNDQHQTILACPGFAYLGGVGRLPVPFNIIRFRLDWTEGALHVRSSYLPVDVVALLAAIAGGGLSERGGGMPLLAIVLLLFFSALFIGAVAHGRATDDAEWFLKRIEEASSARDKA